MTWFHILFVCPVAFSRLRIHHFFNFCRTRSSTTTTNNPHPPEQHQPATGKTSYLPLHTPFAQRNYRKDGSHCFGCRGGGHARRC